METFWLNKKDVAHGTYPEFSNLNVRLIEVSNLVFRRTKSAPNWLVTMPKAASLLEQVAAEEIYLAEREFDL